MKKVLVTGGGGFVGKNIIRMLLDRGVECTAVGRNVYPAVEELGARSLAVDIRDSAKVNEVVRDVDTVFHVAALAGIWGDWQDYYSINVQGTENILAACRKNNISRLVYTSTPSVVFDADDIEGGTESLPYPDKFLCHYARSKVMAEKLVLAANDDTAGGSGFRTCAIRPHLIWGPGDPHLIPRLLEKGRSRELKIVGEGKNLVDISYVENVAHAHVLAGFDLAAEGVSAGKPYFIGQPEPVNLWDWINQLFLKLGIAPVTKSVPFPVAYGAGAVLEGMYGVLGKKQEPRMTRFLALQLAKSHHFSHDAIENDLGYSSVVSTEEGMEKLITWIQHNEKTLL
ncbi:NAD-dependent epimerase/dehydratase family protein [Desulfosediminicola ganghwensis]|uniref:NAD-dependent epimerase/dehydratase family protein n=1 Tax=Desulfosediminicola ganghwensis TaxID=2569540 RepID=UPI0010ACA826|nr:NAD-dependent epimerase/dehydratase family protein [Desulfosediminicola ganghwensis]